MNFGPYSQKRGTQQGQDGSEADRFALLKVQDQYVSASTDGMSYDNPRTRARIQILSVHSGLHGPIYRVKAESQMLLSVGNNALCHFLSDVTS